jgi:exodeoxyribonuclease VII small subunit
VDAAADSRYNPRMAKKEESRSVTFEEAVAQLEQIVAAIESGQIGLEESLAKYEQGMQLVARCRGILDRAEKRIEILNQTGNTITTEPLDPTTILPPETP